METQKTGVTCVMTSQESRGAADHKIHGSDHIPAFESQIGLIFG